MKKFLISSEFENTRLDRWFRKEIFNAPQSYIEKNLRKGNIKINNKKNKSSYRLKKKCVFRTFGIFFLVLGSLQACCDIKLSIDFNYKRRQIL